MGSALCTQKHSTQTSLFITGSLKHNSMSDFSNTIPDDNYSHISYLIPQKLLNVVTSPYSYIFSLWQTKGTTTNKQKLDQSPESKKGLRCWGKHWYLLQQPSRKNTKVIFASCIFSTSQIIIHIMNTSSTASLPPFLNLTQPLRQHHMFWTVHTEMQKEGLQEQPPFRVQTAALAALQWPNRGRQPYCQLPNWICCYAIGGKTGRRHCEKPARAAAYSTLPNLLFPSGTRKKPWDFPRALLTFHMCNSAVS